MKISVMGTGYVGLVSGACLAERGHQVTCIDIRPEVVQEINAGRPPIHEMGLDNLLRSARDKGMLSATTDAKTCHSRFRCNSDLCWYAHGGWSDGHVANCGCRKGNRAALASKRGYHVVAVKSTVLPGTTEGPVKAAIESDSGQESRATAGACA
jgi:UDPglucose 6-dehydrogenase